MVCSGTVVHAEKILARSGQVWTKLFVPVGFDVISVVAKGDCTSLAGCSDVPFKLGLNKEKALTLYYDGKEE